MTAFTRRGRSHARRNVAGVVMWPRHGFELLRAFLGAKEPYSGCGGVWTISYSMPSGSLKKSA